MRKKGRNWASTDELDRSPSPRMDHLLISRKRGRLGVLWALGGRKSLKIQKAARSSREGYLPKEEEVFRR